MTPIVRRFTDASVPGKLYPLAALFNEVRAADLCRYRAFVECRYRAFVECSGDDLVLRFEQAVASDDIPDALQ